MGSERLISYSLAVEDIRSDEFRNSKFITNDRMLGTSYQNTIDTGSNGVSVDIGDDDSDLSTESESTSLSGFIIDDTKNCMNAVDTFMRSSDVDYCENDESKDVE